MFAQLLPYQNELATLLAQQLAGGVFPHSVLLAGERFSGRLSMAMEIARVLSCVREGQSSCLCPSCRRFALFGMSNVVYIGNRDHGTRIAAAMTIARELANERGRRFLIRTVRLMLLQYHGALMDARDSKSSQIFESAAVVSEELDALETAPEQDIVAYVDRLEVALKALGAHYRRSSPLSINQVR